jgi:hypothetical protein
MACEKLLTVHVHFDMYTFLMCTYNLHILYISKSCLMVELWRSNRSSMTDRPACCDIRKVLNTTYSEVYGIQCNTECMVRMQDADFIVPFRM